MDDTRNRIMKATCEAVRQYGLDGVRIQNISELAGLSPGALYRYFDSKEVLLEACFVDVDKKVAEFFDRMDIDWEQVRTEPVKAVCMLWRSYFQFWIARPNETVFYNSFRNTPSFRIFDKNRDTSYFHTLAAALERMKSFFPGLQKINQTMFYIHLLGATVMYARYVVEGILPDNEQTEDEILRLLLSGLGGFLRQA